MDSYMFDSDGNVKQDFVLRSKAWFQLFGYSPVCDLIQEGVISPNQTGLFKRWHEGKFTAGETLESYKLK